MDTQEWMAWLLFVSGIVFILLIVVAGAQATVKPPFGSDLDDTAKEDEWRMLPP